MPETPAPGATHLPPQPSARDVVLSSIGGGLAVAVMFALRDGLSVALVLGSFGASALLLFTFPGAPFSQPRNVVVGHVLSSIAGLAVLGQFGVHGWAVGLAVGIAIAVMMTTRTVHPPAASNPVLVALLAPDWSFVVFPTLVGALGLVAMALTYNRFVRRVKYPIYW